MTAQRGFTLVEMMVAMVIAAILLALAFPSYAGYVTRARRIAAQSHMLALLQQQERHFARSNTYLDFSAVHPADPSTQMQWWAGPAPADSAYEFSASACEGYTLQQCVRIRAEPGTQRVNPSFTDPECGTLEMDSFGARSAALEAKGCWP